MRRFAISCWRGALVFSLAAIGGGTVHAADADGDTFTDGAKAGKPFAFQGEYAGQTPDGNKIGVQVVAKGKGKYQLNAYIGGLPGDGWKRGDQHISVEGTESGDEVTFEKDGNSATIKDGKIAVVHSGEKFELAKTERKSDTLGAKPPEGAVVLFDGKNADAWKGGKLTDDGLLKAGCETKEKFDSYTLHLEFRTPFQPAAKDQGRGNSGVYVYDTYELQVLDSFGLDGKNNECGGFYTLREPDVNMCLPPLSWQTYDIEFTAPKFEDGKRTKKGRVTVKHNGVVIHDDYEFPARTPGRQDEGPGPRQIHLQDHSNPVVYRNIWVVKK